MDRRRFLRSIAAAGVAGCIPAPLLAVAELAASPLPLAFEGLQYGVYPYTTGEYSGLSRLSTPGPYNGAQLTLEVVRRFASRMEISLGAAS